MENGSKKTIIWSTHEPPRNYLWAKDNKVYEYVNAWTESDLFNNETVPVSKIELNKTNVSLKVGKTVNLAVSVTPENTTDKTITWVSSDSKIAHVSSSGKVTGKSEGIATIFATLGGKVTHCNITVSN